MVFGPQQNTGNRFGASIFASLRKELRTKLPISKYDVTLFEPIVASVQKLRNKYLALAQDLVEIYESLEQEKQALLDAGRTQDEVERIILERRKELLKQYRQKQMSFIVSALEEYVIENLDSPVPVDYLAATEVLYYIPLLLEFLAHGWIIPDIQVTCPAEVKKRGRRKDESNICGAKSTINIVLNPMHLSKSPEQITEQDDKQFLETLVEQFNVKTSNLYKLFIKLPTETFEVSEVSFTVPHPNNESVDIEFVLTVGYTTYAVAKQHGFANLISEQIETLPFPEIANIQKMIVRSVDKRLGNVLAEESTDNVRDIVSFVTTMPIHIVELIRRKVKEALKEEPTIESYIEYQCPVCGNVSKINFDPVSYFLATITQEAYHLT